MQTVGSSETLENSFQTRRRHIQYGSACS